jgi:hypothetical protein
MCNNGVNYSATRFPWSQVALSSATSTSSTSLPGNAGPCGLSQTAAQATALGSLSAFPLTKAAFLGPSPSAAFDFAYEDSTGSVVSGFTGSVNRFSTVGNVVLDQAKNNGRTCQQAPCNQLYYAPGQAYVSVPVMHAAALLRVLTQARSPFCLRRWAERALADVLLPGDAR